jgi:hypothetical protein
MTDTPEDWVLLEAAKRSGWGLKSIEQLRGILASSVTFRALCDMIAKHEQKPVDRKLLCAREANELWEHSGEDFDVEQACLRAIELWEEGFGK